MKDSKNHSNYFVPGLHRGLRILEIIGEAGVPLTLSQIGKEMQLSRSSTFRLIYTLRHMGFLKATANERAFELGARVLNLGFVYLSQQDIIQVARPFLENLRDETANSTHLSVLEGRDVLYLETHQSKTAFVSNITTGNRAPAYAAAQGWCLLANLNEAELTALFDKVEFKKFTQFTPLTLSELQERIEQAKKDNVIVSRGYFHSGGSSIIAGIKDNSGKTVAAIDISGPDNAFNFDQIEEFYIPKILQCAGKISQALGFRD